MSKDESIDTTQAFSIPTQSTSATSHTVIDVVDEYVDRERCKNSLIIYGLPEPECSAEEQYRISDKQHMYIKFV